MGHTTQLNSLDASRRISGKGGSIAGSEIHGLPKFDETTHDETLKQEWCARRDVWELAKEVRKINKESKDTFFSPAEAWVMLAPYSRRPEERQFVMDSGASMHVVNKKNLSSGESQEI